MPVLGHAFVGLAIGMSTWSSAPRHSESRGILAASVLWLPAVVTLAYLPDVVAQFGLIAGWSDGRLLGHSVMFAVTVSPAIAAVLMRLAAVSFARALVTSLVSLLVHDVLDLAQATDRAPWWPMSSRTVAFDLALIPTGILGETAVFGGLLLAFLAVRQAAHRWGGKDGVDSVGPGAWLARRVWLGPAFIVTIVLAAVLTHSLRDAREADLERGRVLVSQRAYQAALDALARAEHWPSAARAGRVDYLRAEAYVGLGDRRRAEASYLRAYRADPTYFWVVADLALFYASSSESVSERRRLAAPYLTRLRTGFAGHRDLPWVLARAERKLAIPPSEGALDAASPPATPASAPGSAGG